MKAEVKFAAPINKIPKRDEKASPKQINLEKYYSFAIDDEIHGKPGNTLSSLPQGLQNLGNTVFDIRGVIQLEGQISEEKTHLKYAKEARDIEINQKADKIHFLQASAWDVEDPQMIIGKYIVHYENKGKIEIPIIYKVNVWDWWATEESGVTQAPVWKGENVRTKELGMHIRLFKYSWENPNPALKIISLDFISNIEIPAPILVAITIE
jgi:hypothetical protein